MGDKIAREKIRYKVLRIKLAIVSCTFVSLAGSVNEDSLKVFRT